FVPSDQKNYAQAQQAIELWGNMILDLAKARATNGNFDLAIQIGELVPPNAPNYGAAQEAIADWRNPPAANQPNQETQS
ncbi:MAG: peptidase C14, partial [Elainella sp.]